jgi:hypothetical protein
MTTTYGPPAPTGIKQTSAEGLPMRPAQCIAQCCTNVVLRCMDCGGLYYVPSHTLRVGALQGPCPHPHREPPPSRALVFAGLLWLVIARVRRLFGWGA